MTAKTSLRRAALLAVPFGLVACDVVAFATDPKPIFEQTWNVPATQTSISVAELIPANVTITPDSSAFVLNINNVVFSRRLGADCAACQSMNGTTGTKPAFVLNAGSSSPLPVNVVSGAVVGGSVTYSIVNNLSFDPIRVRALNNPPQGYLVVVIRSGSIVLGKDSVNGATTAFPAGSTLSRPVPLSSGTVAGSISVDLTVNSPVGDHNEFINANGTLNTTAQITNFLAGNIVINVPNKSISTPGESLDLGAFGSNVQSATLEMSVQNPWSVAGTLSVDFTTPSQTVSKSLVIPPGTNPVTAQVTTITLDQTDVQKLVGEDVDVTLTGTMNSSTPITVTPRQSISIDNRLIITVRTGGGN